jgi:hypothetical protein
MSAKQAIRDAGDSLNYLLIMGFLGIVWLMIYGNLSGNLGFASGSQGYNDTQVVINNMTGGAKTFFGFSNTIFTIAAIVLLISILLGLVAVVMKIVNMSKSKGGFAGE